MHKIWTVKVDGGNGKEIYGEDYADIWALNRLHFKAAMNRTCDHVSLRARSLRLRPVSSSSSR